MIRAQNDLEEIFQVGKNYFIRTVTCYYTGEVVKVTKSAVVLAKAAWIPDTGRFCEAMSSGKFQDVEPYPEDMQLAVMTGGMIDANPFPFPLPRKASSR
jgi:hypothetical protein